MDIKECTVTGYSHSFRITCDTSTVSAWEHSAQWVCLEAENSAIQKKKKIIQSIILNQWLKCFLGVHWLLPFTYPIRRAVSECKHCVCIYHSGTKGMAKPQAKALWRISWFGYLSYELQQLSLWKRNLYWVQWTFSIQHRQGIKKVVTTRMVYCTKPHCC